MNNARIEHSIFQYCASLQNGIYLGFIDHLVVLLDREQHLTGITVARRGLSRQGNSKNGIKGNISQIEGECVYYNSNTTEVFYKLVLHNSRSLISPAQQDLSAYCRATHPYPQWLEDTLVCLLQKLRRTELYDVCSWKHRLGWLDEHSLNSTKPYLSSAPHVPLSMEEVVDPQP